MFVQSPMAKTPSMPSTKKYSFTLMSPVLPSTAPSGRRSAPAGFTAEGPVATKTKSALTLSPFDSANVAPGVGRIAVLTGPSGGGGISASLAPRTTLTPRASSCRMMDVTRRSLRGATAALSSLVPLFTMVTSLSGWAALISPAISTPTGPPPTMRMLLAAPTVCCASFSSSLYVSKGTPSAPIGKLYAGPPVAMTIKSAVSSSPPSNSTLPLSTRVTAACLITPDFTPSISDTLARFCHLKRAPSGSADRVFRAKIPDFAAEKASPRHHSASQGRDTMREAIFLLDESDGELGVQLLGQLGPSVASADDDDRLLRFRCSGAHRPRKSGNFGQRILQIFLQPIRVQWRRGERFSSAFKNIRTLRSFRKAPEGSFYNFYLSRNVEAINRFAIAALKRRNSVFSSGVSEEPLDFLGDLVRKLRLHEVSTIELLVSTVLRLRQRTDKRFVVETRALPFAGEVQKRHAGKRACADLSSEHTHQKVAVWVTHVAEELAIAAGALWQLRLIGARPDHLPRIGDHRQRREHLSHNREA
mmetsp:Transcript_1308/g.5590  ORF Transcript_1308/g.5590 Transcript_1308/m.5590 type:complete len:531 (-) Transcript_1308:525-2117(-)